MYKITILIFIFQKTITEQFSSFKFEMEDKVSRIALKMEQLYRNRCDEKVMKCQIKSYHSCKGIGQKQCMKNFPKTQLCLDEGTFLSPLSSIHLPIEITQQTLSNSNKEFICSSAFLEDQFKKLQSDRNKRFSFSYIGTWEGLERSYPSFPTFSQTPGNCSNYDPRYRPWYVSATSGSKNIILLLDISGSMKGQKLEAVKNAAIAVIQTLNNYDFIGVLTFGTTARNLAYSQIVRATNRAKANLIQQIEALAINGKTNYQQALKKGFEMIIHAKHDHFGSSCPDAKSIFLFLTDGNPTEGLSTFEDLSTLIKSYSTDIILFTYGFGTQVDLNLLQRLSCEFDGISFAIKNDYSKESLLKTMRNYFLYISQGLKIVKPIWTEPYEDAFGFGRTVTVAMPIYYYENSTRKIIGVAGHDIQLAKLQSFGLTQDQFLRRIISEAPCQSNQILPCQIESLRSSPCGLITCNEAFEVEKCSKIITTSVFLDPVTSDTSICCGLTIVAFAAIMGSIAGVLIIIGIVLYCRYRRNQKKNLLIHVKKILQMKRISLNPQDNQILPMTQISALQLTKQKRKQTQED